MGGIVWRVAAVLVALAAPAFGGDATGIEREAREIAAALERIRGLRFERPVPVRFETRQRHRARVRASARRGGRNRPRASVLESVWGDEDEAREAQRRWREVRERGYRWEVRRETRALTVRRLPLE